MKKLLVNKIFVLGLSALLLCACSQKQTDVSSVKTETDKAETVKKFAYLGGVEAEEVSILPDEFAKFNEDGRYKVYKDSEDIYYFMDADNVLRIVLNRNPQNNPTGSVDDEVDRLLQLAGIKDEYKNLDYLWSDDENTKELSLVQHFAIDTMQTDIVLASVVFDKEGRMISGNFNLDAYYDEAEVVSDETCVSIAWDLALTEIGQEACDQLKANSDVSVTYDVISGDIVKRVDIKYTGEAPFNYVFERDYFDYIVVVNAFSGEVVYSDSTK